MIFLRLWEGVFLFCLGALAFSSCSGGISGQIGRDGAGSVHIQAALGPNTAALFRSLGDSTGGPLLDAAGLNRSIRSAPGAASSELRNTGKDQISGSIGFNRIGDLLAAGDSRLITYKDSAGTEPGRLGIRADRNSAPQILSRLSPEAADYLSALMAPAATGEALSKKEYLELVGSIYGKNIAGEIASSALTAVLTVPGQIIAVKGGRFSGREARFELSLADILTLEQPLDWEITWK